MFRLRQVLDHFFPELYERIAEMEDYREHPKYRLVEVVVGALALFLFKEGSRNALNNERQEAKFLKNYRRVFKVRLPHMDTVDELLRQLKEEELARLKAEMVATLIEKKVLGRYKFLDQYYRVAVDGTHVVNVPQGHCEHCLKRTSERGKVTYFHNVLEAKLVGENGFCLSLASEWIENSSGDFHKQDDERKAFKRLAEKLKVTYPRLPMCIVADALYPNAPFFQLCRQYGWAFVVTFKDGNLPSVWEEVLGLQKLLPDNQRQENFWRKGQSIQRSYRWINHIAYASAEIHFFECLETVAGEQTRFVYLASLPLDYRNVLESTQTGRLRWKIENEGFNTQKHGGYGLTHKFSRVSYLAMKNYYQALQIAHLLNQLFELSSLCQPLLVGKMTLKHLWKKMLGEMREKKLKRQELAALLQQKIQIRFT